MISPAAALEHSARTFFRARRLPDPIKWCRQNVVIDDRVSQFRGPFSLDLAPDAPEILRSMVDPAVETTVIVGPTQFLKTTLLIGAACYVLKNIGGAVTWVLDSRDNARDFSNQRWQPTVSASHGLSDLITGDLAAFTALTLPYANGTLRFAGSGSPGKVSSFPASTIIGDEVDKYPQLLRDEAGTLEQVTDRTGASFGYRRWLASSPTVTTGTIWLAALKGDCRRFHTPCPHCSQLFVWNFAQLQWDKAARGVDGRWDMARVERTAHYVCPHCQGEIHEHHRRDILEDSRWIPSETQPLDLRCHSYFRSSFHNLHPNKSFARIAQKHLEAGREPSARQNFTNSWLGDAHEEEGAVLDDKDVAKRAEAYLEHESRTLPEGALVLTAGIDVQGDRIEAEIVGWGEGDESWGIQYRVIPGDPTTDQPWDDLEEWLQRRWLHPAGFVLSPAAACFDTGHESDRVYKFVRPRLARRYFATKGSSGGYGEPLVARPRKSGVHVVPLFMIGTITAKEIVYSRLRLPEPGPGYMHFPKNPKRGYDSDFFRQLTAEKCVTKWKAGRKTKTFINPSGRRNEALDVRICALVAKELLNPDLTAIALGVRQTEMELPQEIIAQASPSQKSPLLVPPDAAAEKTREEREEFAKALGQALANASGMAPILDLATGKITRPAPTPEQVAAAGVNTYKPIIAPPPEPARAPAPRKNFATSW